MAIRVNSESLEHTRGVIRKVMGLEPGQAIESSERIQLAARFAAYLQTRANNLITATEKRQQHELDRLIQNPLDRATLVQMTDQVFRCKSPRRSASQLTHILDVQGIPRFFNPFDKALLRGFRLFGTYLPGVAMPLVKRKMRHETSNVVLPAESHLLCKHLALRHQQGVRMNVNFLGEELLGEEQAAARIMGYVDALKNPEIEVISVKISTLYSQISHVARQKTIDEVADRLRTLFQIARNSKFMRSDGSQVSKMVYLDMEQYRDMTITVEAFIQALSTSGLEDVRAGIALQTYLPDAYEIQKFLTSWSMLRQEQGADPITIRLVKGANLEMERVDASTNGWAQAPFKHKSQTDANFKRMLHYALKPERSLAVNIGVASHNMFDVAYAMILANENNVLDAIQFEMLEGMANHLRRAIFDCNNQMLLYVPACKQKHFANAIGYLVRRLDENTGRKNFLRHAFNLKPGTRHWDSLKQDFMESFEVINNLPRDPRRTQNRLRPTPRRRIDDWHWHELINEPDTDFSLPANAQWASDIVAQWKSRTVEPVLPVINGSPVRSTKSPSLSMDPSQPDRVVGKWCEASEADIALAIECARIDETHWRATTASERSEILRAVANQLRRSRADLTGICMAESGKIITEADSEVSEAIDFVEFYRKSAVHLESISDLKIKPRGTTLVISPWNFPIAIPCGGIAAALAAGNTVILKPSSHTVLTAHMLCECFWKSGVSRKVLQLAPCDRKTGGQRLIKSREIDTIIFTGSTSAGRAIHRISPRARVIAETGGKNTTFVSAMSDREQAVQNILRSAFSHSGQKCSATSLLILEDAVYHDNGFQDLLLDATSSLKVGSVWDLDTKVGPLIRPPSHELKQGLSTIEEKEAWLLAPEFFPDNPHLVSPSIKWNVRKNTLTHLTEFFGPLLGVLKANDMDHAIDIANTTGYGLTAGLESLDEREQNYWRQRIFAGNLYINRPTTGAIVLRQPFGGFGNSAIGPGIKAGGPNYVTQLLKYRTRLIQFEADLAGLRNSDLKHMANEVLNSPSQQLNAVSKQLLIQAITSYDRFAQSEFNVQHDHFHLVGQDNIRRYLPIRDFTIRVTTHDEPFEVVARIAAAKAVGTHIEISHEAGVHNELIRHITWMTRHWIEHIHVVTETNDDLIARIEAGKLSRIRYSKPGAVPQSVRRTMDEYPVYIADELILVHGRVELLWYVMEQTISNNYHRYGNLGARMSEVRLEPM